MYDINTLNLLLKSFKSFDTLRSWGFFEEDKTIAEGAVNLIKKIKSNVVIQDTKANVIIHDKNEKLTHYKPENNESKKPLSQFILTSPKAKHLSEDITQSIQLLSNVKSDFINKNIYFEKGGHKIQPYATCDLYDYVRSKLFIELPVQKKQETIVKILSQIILSIEALHKHHIVHRDIKPENFLCTILPNGEPLVQLTDFDAIIKVNKNGKPFNVPPISGSKDFIPDDLLYAFDRKRNEFLINYNFFKADTFGIGALFDEIAQMKCLNGDQTKSLYFLVDKLKKGCIDFTEIKQSLLFGNNAKEQQEFFTQREIQAKEAILLYDQYYLVATPDMDDSFYLLPPSIKEFYLRLETISINLASINDRKLGDKLIPYEEYEVVRQQLVLLKESITLELKTGNKDSFKKQLGILENALNTIQKQLLNDQEESKLSFASWWNKTHSTLPLKQCALASFKQYKSENKMDTTESNFFAKKNPIDFFMTEMISGQSVKEVQATIKKFIQSQTNDPAIQEFKQILQKNYTELVQKSRQTQEKDMIQNQISLKKKL